MHIGRRNQGCDVVIMNRAVLERGIEGTLRLDHALLEPQQGAEVAGGRLPDCHVHGNSMPSAGWIGGILRGMRAFISIAILSLVYLAANPPAAADAAQSASPLGVWKT